MIKNREIIQTIPQDRKLEMIADGNTLGSEEHISGAPRVIPASFGGINSASGEIYPSYSFLANSWNGELISAVSGDLALRAKTSGVNLLFTPEAKTKGNPYASGISEDSFYSGAVIYNIVKSAKSLGVTPCVTGCALTDCDAAYLDLFPDARAIREYMFGFLDFFEGAYGNVFMTAFTRLSGRYEKVNCETVSALLQTAAADGGYVISSQTDKELAAASVAAGNVFSYSGDLQALKEAVANYENLSAAIKKGEATADELEEACREGRAISPEAVDGAADKAVDFALYCNMNADSQSGKTFETETLSLQAAEESIVLLKNDGALPLNGERICVIGQPALVPDPASGQSFADLISKNNKFTFAGAAQGYDLSDERNDELLQEAVSLAKGCNAALVFLGLDKQKEEELYINRRLKLPANRLALLGALKDAGVKIIAVLTTSASVDVSFDDSVSALLCAPLNCSRGGEALINILNGKSPSGKLANTLYADTDEYFEKIKKDKDCGRIRIGLFSGYRYYATAGIPVKYPFGHGLSYTKFTYSDLTVQGDQIYVTVTNSGGCDGSEVVQLYAGKPDSKIVRPARELKSFIKMRLRAGESKTLRFHLHPEKLAAYCKDSGKKVVEGGVYNIFVGSSANDIKLTGRINVNGTAIKPDNVRFSDYIPTVSNVVEGGYTLAPVQKVSPNGKKLKLAGLITMLAAAFGCVILGILHLVNATSVTYDTGAVVALSFMAEVFIAGVILLCIGVALMKKARANPMEVCTSKPQTVKAEDDSLDSLFEAEFGEEEEPEEQPKEAETDEREILKYLDDSLDFAKAAENLSAFCTERGVSVNIRAARKILSAFASCRLILLKGVNPALNSELLRLLCEFFGAETNLEIYGKCGGAEELLKLGGGSILNTVKSTAENKHCVQPVCLDGADIGDLGAIFAPFAKYMKNPEGGASLCLSDGEIKLPRNIWFVLTLSENSTLSTADIYAAEIACVIDLDIATAAEKEEKTEFVKLSYYQLKKLSDAAKKAYTLDEDGCWKKVDKLEKYINSHTPYSIDNKVWQRIERFVSAYLACGGEQADALDCVVAAKLIIAACASLNGKLKPSDGTVLSEVENIFGEEHISEIKNILKYSGMSSGRRTGNAGK